MTPNSKATTISPTPWTVSEGGTLIQDKDGETIAAYLGPWSKAKQNMALLAAAPALIDALADLMADRSRPHGQRGSDQLDPGPCGCDECEAYDRAEKLLDSLNVTHPDWPV